MVKVRFDSKKFNKELKKKFGAFTKDKTEMEKVAKTVLRNIKADARNGVAYDGSNFPQIKESTIERRGKLAESNKTNRFYGQYVSNATFMGDTINKIFTEVIGKGRIQIFGKGKHRKMKGVSGKPLKGSDADIGEILSGLSSMGWKIIGVSKKSKDSIKKQFIRFLRRKR